MGHRTLINEAYVVFSANVIRFSQETTTQIGIPASLQRNLSNVTRPHSQSARLRCERNPPGYRSTRIAFIRLFGDKDVLREWFAQLVLYSQAVTFAELYCTYNQIGIGALRMLGKIHNVAICDSDVEELKSRIHDLPVHPEVSVTLQRLRDAHFRLVTLTNSAPDLRGNPLERNGLNRYFERMFSVHSMGRLKPAPGTYRSVAESLAE